MNKEEFKALLSKPCEVVKVEYEGLVFHLKKMTEKQGIDYDLSIQDKEGNFLYEKARRTMLAMVLVDESGNPLVDKESELESMDVDLAEYLFDEARQMRKRRNREVSAELKKSDDTQG